MSGKEGLIEFYNARDQFLGIGNYTRRQSISNGLVRLRRFETTTQEAEWVLKIMRRCQTYFWSLSAHDNVKASQIFLERSAEPECSKEEKAMCLTYYGILLQTTHRVREAATLGNAMAQVRMTEDVLDESDAANDVEVEEWLTKSRLQGNRVAFWLSGNWIEKKGLRGMREDEPPPTEDDRLEALHFYKQGADLGHGYSMFEYGRLGFSIFNPERYQWYGRAARNGWTCRLVKAAKMIVVMYDKYADLRVVHALYTIGKEFNHNVLGNFVFEKHVSANLLSNNKAPYVTRTVYLYKKWKRRAKEAVYSWMFCASRLGLHRDVARLIGTLVRNGTDYCRHEPKKKYSSKKLKR
jgi:hypothetical protein